MKALWKHKKLIIVVLAIMIVIAGAIIYVLKNQNIKGCKVTKKGEKTPIVAASNKAAAGEKKITADADFPEGTELEYNDKKVPVLYYHSIATEKGNELRMPVDKFRQQMQYLKDNGYYTLSLDQLYDFLVNNKAIPKKSVVITLDDGYEDNYTGAFPILKEFRFHAAIFVITKTVDTYYNYLTSAQLKEMSDYGIDIESHTVSHNELNQYSYEQQYKELHDSKQFLEALLQKPVKYFAYPSGKYNQNTFNALKEAGYCMAFNTENRWAGKEDGIYTLKRVFMSSAFGMDVFIERVNNPDYKLINN